MGQLELALGSVPTRAGSATLPEHAAAHPAPL
jgi:hypothetical protein